MNQNTENHSAWTAASAALKMINAFQNGLATYARYASAFSIPTLIAAGYFGRVEKERFWTRTPMENLQSYLQLGTMNLEIADRAMDGSMKVINQSLNGDMSDFMSALMTGDIERLDSFAGRVNTMIDSVAYRFPEAIKKIESEFGFHFERQPPSSKIDETDRFILYQVLPNAPAVSSRKDGKPLLIVPPFVLGANILSFLPGENRSYAHAFANQGIPTYIRILKDIQTSEAVQLMTPEQDAEDMQRFCEKLKALHGRPVTLNGYCQGGFAALCHLLSGRLDSLVDAFISCVSPMDGTRSPGLAGFLGNLPAAFNDLAYGCKVLPNGRRVADGILMGWVYKLRSIQTEAPLMALWRDMQFTSKGGETNIRKSAAAINYWLTHDRNDLPEKITRMSFQSYNTPITAEGILPVKLFGQALDIHRIQAKKIPWLICYGEQDDLVEPPAALAPLDYVNAEVTGYPSGHVAIATSWSRPDSSHPLDAPSVNGRGRGPVRFQLDLQAEYDAKRLPVARKKNKKKQAAEGEDESAASVA